MNDEKAKALLSLLFGEKLRSACRESVYAALNRAALRRADLPDTLTGGVALWGMAGESSGMGQCCRSMASALEASDLPYALHPLHSRAGGTLSLDAYADALREERDMAVNLFCANADCTGYFLRQSGAGVLKGRKNIALWAWELPNFPKRWKSAFDWYDEIWTISEFCRGAIAAATDKTVRVLPLCVEPKPQQGLSRADFGLPEDKLLYLSMYDARSIQARKNPHAAIAAYCAAFPEEGDTALVLKISGGEQGRAEARELREAITRRDIYIIEGVLPAEKLYALMGLCDVFVSLHRSEGFGYPIAEAMSLGLAAVVTGYSGNMDFCTADNACCVGYTLRELGDAAVAPYEPHQLWAEPDVSEAAAYMRRLRDDESFRLRLAKAGQAAVREKYSAEACGRAVERALKPVLPSPSGEGGTAKP